MLLSGTINAQPVLKITEMFPNWPFISLKYTYRCDGNWEFNIPDSKIQVFENGVEVKNYTLRCPDEKDLCPLAIAIVLDGSESMAGFKNEQARTATKNFINLMDGDKDEASLFWFNQTVTLRVPMTDDRDKLLAAVDELPATNLTAVWDGAYAGINHVANFTRVPSQCRAVILLSDGKDNTSTRTLQSVIAYAVGERVRVFVVAIGDAVNEVGLNALATQTDGKYFRSVDAVDLTKIFERVFLEARSLQECELFYQASCPDGTEREVELRISDYCGGTVSEKRTYTAPLDSSTFAIGYFEPGTVTAQENTTAGLPIHALSLPYTGLFPAGSLTLKYDTSCISFVDVYDSGTLLQGANVRSKSVPGGVKLEWDDIEITKNFGTLMMTYFRTFSTDSSACCEVEMTDFHFEHGCLKPLTGKGNLCYYSNPPEVECSITVPDSLSWSYEEDGYVPNPFKVTYIIRNTGVKPARNVRYSINYDPRKVTLIQPVSPNQKGNLEDLGRWQADTVSWLVKVNPQGKAGSIDICVSAHFDNRGDLDCCYSIRVEQAPTTMLCSIDAPRIVAQQSLERYTPMPFILTASVLNTGEKDKDSITVEITLPPGMQLFENEVPKKFVTARLMPDSSASTMWALWHPPVTDSLFLPVSVTVISSDGDTTHCETIVVIPPLAAPWLEVSCSVPSFLDLDPFDFDYSPNPFQATLSIKNSGTRPAANLNAFLMLPDFVEIVGADPQRKNVVPSTLAPGETATVQWTLRYTKKQTDDQRLYCRWSVGYTTEGGLPLDTVKSECDIAVPGVPTSLVCEISAPDTLFVDPNLGLIYPNPVPFNVSVRNKTVASRGLVSVRAQVVLGDVTFEASTPPVRMLNTMMNPGRVVDLVWYLRIKPSQQEQRIVVVVYVLDTEGIETYCTHTIVVPPSPLYISCTIASSSRFFTYQRTTGTYFPDSLVVSAVLRNESEGTLTDVPVRLELDGEDDYLEVDQTISGNTVERTVPSWPKDSTRAFEWIVRPKKNNESEHPEVIVFAVSYFDPELGWLRTGCTIDVVIEPVNVLDSQISCEILAPDTIRFVDSSYVPDIFSASVRVTNEGEVPATNVQIYLLLDARFSGIGPSIRAVPSIPSGATHVVSPDFELRVSPLRKEGYDTLRVLVIADDGLSTTCEIPVFIERQTSPEVFVECVANVDTIRFNAVTNSYEPDEIQLSTIVANTGDGIARYVAATALIPSGYQILDSATVSLGTLQLGDFRNIIWRIKPTCETVGSLDSLRVIVRGTGGIGNQLHVSECSSVLYKEPCAEPSIALACSLPDTVRITSDSGSYVPAPLLYTFTITNTSQFTQSSLSVRFISMGGLTLAQGESIVKPVPDVAPGKDYTLTWEVVPVSGQGHVTGRACAEVLFGESVLDQCCSEFVIMPFSAAGLAVACSAPDSLFLNPSKKGYLDIPFDFCADVTNTSATPIQNIEYHLVMSAGLEAAEPVTRILPGPYGPGVGLPAQCWTINVYPSNRPKQAWVKVTVIADGKTVQCTSYLFVPEVPAGPVRCNASLPGGDTLISTRTTVRFPVDIAVTREDGIPWDGITASILVSAPAQLAPGEPVVLQAMDGVISGNTSQLTWQLELPPIYRDANARITITLFKDGEEISTCEVQPTIIGVEPAVTLRIPDDLFASFGRRFSIPVYVDTIDPVMVSEFKLQVSYDPSLVHITGYASDGTVTEVGWKFTSFVEDNINGMAELTGKTVGSGSHLTAGQPMCYLVGSTVGNERKEELAFFESPLQLILPGVQSGSGTEMRASVDGLSEVMNVRTYDGTVYVTGDCILPVNASGGFFALSNTPNPFNPDTRVTFVVPEAMDVKVTVHDVFGRTVITLFDGWASSGKTSLQFQAAQLPAGVYISIMETPFGVITNKMNLVK